MALLLEDGTGIALSETYITLADVNIILARFPNKASWFGLVDTEKEEWIRFAAIALDEAYATKYPGCRASGPQGLEWPRLGATDIEGYTIGTSEIPVALQNAQAFLANGLYLDPPDLTPHKAEDQVRFAQAGPVRMAMDVHKTKRLIGDLPECRMWLARIIGFGRGHVGQLSVAG